METAVSRRPTAADPPSLGPNPEPFSTERVDRLMSRCADGLSRRAQDQTRHRSQSVVRHRFRAGRRIAGSLPIPACLRSEPSLLTPYLTDGRKLLRIVTRVWLGSEMVLLLEDCRTLEVSLKTWPELAGRVRAVANAARAVSG